MKSALKIFICGMIAVFSIGIVVSCSSNLPTDQEVAQKISSNSQLDQSDYTTIIDYCGKYAKEAQPYYDIINAQANDSTAEYIKASGDLASLYAKYSYLDQFRNALAAADMNILGSENEKKVNEYADYQGFPLPGEEAAELENPKVVGMIEDMPSTKTTDSTGVISVGDGEAVK